ncbi:MAG: alpha/beta fold hydrolase [Planctomycetes bacterium]|nr:alpha/beta fold hydrolase [Planctomycetota bacterium]
MRKRSSVACAFLVTSLAAFADPPGEPVFTSVRESVRAEATSEANLPARLLALKNLAMLVAPTAGPEAMEKALPREAFDRIVELVRAGDTETAAGSIDRALLALCDLGERSGMKSARKVSFPGTDGARVAALLFEPEQPSTFGLVFGHGGYGSKEGWADVALALSRAGVWVLDMDFEGAGESGGVSAWSTRIRDFSLGIDFLQSELRVTRFGVAGHSGGGAWPAACAAIDDPRVSTAVLWDCPFDFYDIHLVKDSEDPGGNPAAVLEDVFEKTRSEPAALRPPEVNETRGLPGRFDAMYEEVEATLSRYRHPARLLAQVQEKRPLAVLHIVAEELVRQLGPSPRGGKYELPGESRSEVRARYLGRSLRFQESELFVRPEGLWERWDRELGEPKRTVLIRGTNHAFAPPGRMEAVRESVEWLSRHLLVAAPRETLETVGADEREVRLPVASPTVRCTDSVPSAEKGAGVDDFSKAFPARTLSAKDGAVAFKVGREPVYVLDGDTSLPSSAPAESSPFGFHPASVPDPKDPYGHAREIGVRWHRGLYAYWILLQPTEEDIDGGVFHWEQNDREWGLVPESMAIFGNIGLPERRGTSEAGKPTLSGWRLNKPEEAYLRFVKAAVERYDGDGVDDMPGLSVPIRHWQFENEPDIASEDWEGYAHLHEITYDAIKEACPEARIALGGQTGGGVAVFERFFAPVLSKLGGKRVDIYDIHYYGDAKMDWRGVKDVYDHIRRRLDELGYAKTEVWITEMGSYSGAPGDEEPKRRPARTERERNRERDLAEIPEPPRLRLPPQSEREQARDVVKRHAYTLSLGVKKTFWAWGLVEGFMHDDGYFDHTGFVYDGEFDEDPPRGTRKLAYHTYRKMTETLDGADWSRAEALELGKDVYAIRVPRGQGTVTVVWCDPPYPISATVPPDALEEIRRRLEDLGESATDAQNLRARFGALREVVMLALDAGGPSAVDSWAPFDRMKRLEKQVLEGAGGAPAEVDAILREACEFFR